MTTETPPDPLGLVGTTIVEKYAVESIVGLGGFATVFRANHILWKRPVAVKVFTALGQVPADQRGTLLEDFIREGALLAELSEQSTAICQARDVGMLTTPKGDIVPYMVLEWLEGKPLDSIVEEERAMKAQLRSLDAVLKLLDPIAEALSIAHGKRIAHRDVKPANIFVLKKKEDGTDGGVKLLDFGIAKVVQDAQKMGFGQTAGHITSFTPLYGAPEQFNRSYGSTGPWTDVFALALVVTELVSGEEPLGGDTIVQLAQAASDPVTRPTPRQRGVTLGTDVEAVFLKALAVKPDDRYPTAGEFWSALRAAAAGDQLSRLQMARVQDRSAVGNAETMLGTGPPDRRRSAEDLVANASTAIPTSSSPVLSTSSVAAAGSPAKSRAPLFVGLGVAALVLAGGAFALRGLGNRPQPITATPTASASAPTLTPMMSATTPAPAPAMTCDAGMVLIAGAEFFMGSDEKDAFPFEKPPHKVKLAPYCIDALEATVADYKQCSDGGHCRRAGKENVWPGIVPAQRKIYDPLCNINDPAGRPSHPINCVDWDQAREFCENRSARLPTEAEWELAARGSDGRIYPWGDDPPNEGLLNACGKECFAWMKKHSDPQNPAAQMFAGDDGFANTAPVGSFPKGKSLSGLSDIVGNVGEWVGDYYADYEKALAGTTSADPKGPTAGTDRVVRGGAWNSSDPSWVRPSFRYHAAPDARSHGIGFRCAKSAASKPQGPTK